MHMLRYTKREDWSLTITNIVQCLESASEAVDSFTKGLKKQKQISYTFQMQVFRLSTCLFNH